MSRHRWSPSSGRPPPASPTSALALAAELGGEVVNADAMQLYRGLDIGHREAHRRPSGPASRITCSTCSTSPRPPSVAAYQRAARDVVERLRGGRAHAGAGRRLRAVRAGRRRRAGVPRHGSALRAELEAELAERGPGRAARPARRSSTRPRPRRCCPRTARRIVRALEVIALTGRPFPARLPTPGRCPLRRRAARHRPRRPPSWTSAIARRVARMFAAGSRRRDPRRCSPRPARRAHRVAGAGLPAGASPRSTAAAPSPTAAADTVRGDPPVRAPAAVVVPPGPPRSTGWTAPAPTCSTGASGVAEPSRTLERRRAVQQGARHRERLRAAAGPRRRARPDPGPGGRALRPPPRHRRRRRAAGGALGSAADGPRAGTGRRVVHGLPQRRRQRRRDVRQRGARVYARYLGRRAAGCPGDGAAAGYPRRASAPCALDGDEVSVDMGPATSAASARPASTGRRSPAIAVDVGNPHLACVTDVPSPRSTSPARPGTTPTLFPHGVNVEFVTPLGWTAARSTHAGARARGRGDPLVRHRAPSRPSSRRCGTPAATPASSRCTPPAAACASRSTRAAPPACTAPPCSWPRRAVPPLVGRPGLIW